MECIVIITMSRRRYKTRYSAEEWTWDIRPEVHFVTMTDNMLCFILLLIVPVAKGSVPGTFFWKPRLGIDLNAKATEPSSSVHYPTKENILAGLVVFIDGYKIGLTVIAFAAGLSSMEAFVYLNPFTAHYHTNVYRWTLRHLSMVPFWLGGTWGNYVNTHRTWKRRFYYMDHFIPPWIKFIFPYIDSSDWAKEENEFKRFKKYSEPAFGRHYRYPAREFHNFRSEITRETMEGLDMSSDSTS